MLEHDPDQNRIEKKQQQQPTEKRQPEGPFLFSDQGRKQHAESEKTPAKGRQHQRVIADCLPGDSQILKSAPGYAESQRSKNRQKYHQETGTEFSPIIGTQRNRHRQQVFQDIRFTFADNGSDGGDEDEHRKNCNAELKVGDQHPGQSGEPHDLGFGDSEGNQNHHCSAENQQINQKPAGPDRLAQVKECNRFEGDGSP